MPCQVSTTYRYVKAFLTISILLITIGSSYAQTPPVTFELLPSEFADGDTIDLKISYGTQSNPVVSLMSVQFTFACEDFTVAEGSELILDLSNSWFGWDGNWTGSTTINEERDTITIDLSRTNGQSVDGQGEIALVTGILVDIEDLIGKRGRNPLLKLIDVQERTLPNRYFSVFPNPAKNQLKVQAEPVVEAQTLRLINAEGVVAYSQKGIFEEAVIDVSRLPAGIYVIQIVDKFGVRERKVMLR